MEMGSGSLDESGTPYASSPAAESVNGLKFGKKIYFEDHVGAGTPAKGGNGSSSSGSGSGSASSARKGQSGQQQQPPRCQVEGCRADLSEAKAYYSRHKVCGMHSKSPKVIVAGLEQRFCQQCSRFHLLPEFDQGKRSCRRRLAGHNERRRKPPPGSMLSSSRYGRFSPTMFDNSSRPGGFLVDFSAYSAHPERNRWPVPSSSSEHVPGNQTTSTGRSVPLWQNSSQSPPSNIYLQGSTGGTFSSPGIPSGECFTGVSVSDSSCALSLLSNQSWGSRNRAPGLGVNDLLSTEGANMPQSTAPHVAVNQFPNPPWSFKGNEGSSSTSHEMCPDLGLSQIARPLDSEFSCQLELPQQNRRQYMDLEHSSAYNSSTEHIHWSL